MGLSDELLDEPARLTAVRARVVALVDELDVPAAFLVDENGVPFATVGHVEFRFPHPLASLRESASVLEAMVGEPGEKSAPGLIVERAGPRALLAVVPGTGGPIDARDARRHVRRSAKALSKLL